MDLPLRLFNYFIHWLYSSSEKGNCDFFRDFGLNILHNKTVYPEYELIENYRISLLNNNSMLETHPLGAGTRNGQKKRTVSSIARSASVNAKYGQLLFRLVRYYKPDQIVELGTALGISTMYLAMGNPGSSVISVEGNPRLGEIAARSFSYYGLHNITLINSNFDDAIPILHPDLKSNALVFIDGNHTLEATLRYYSLLSEASGLNRIMVLDDINWSAPMAKAWRIITDSECRGMTIDLFQLGIIFLGQNYNRQKFRFRY